MYTIKQQLSSSPPLYPERPLPPFDAPQKLLTVMKIRRDQSPIVVMAVLVPLIVLFDESLAFSVPPPPPGLSTRLLSPPKFRYYLQDHVYTTFRRPRPSTGSTRLITTHSVNDDNNFDDDDDDGRPDDNDSRAAAAAAWPRAALQRAVLKFQKRPGTYLLIPCVAALVGWFTNWLAVQMIFYPIQFRGIPIYQRPEVPLGFLGWQGIIPCKTRPMTEVMVNM